MQKKIITKESEKFLEAYLNNPSPTGFESQGQSMWLNYIQPYIDTHFVDTYGTVVGVINPDEEYKVVIEAHADEISWFVHYITKDGFIYLRRNGGSDHQIAPSKRVNIHTKQGIVKAVFGWPAIHTRTAANEKPPKLDNIFLDCGCNDKEEVEKLGVHVGCVVTYEDNFMILNKRNYVGRALDNRIGGFMIAEVARLLYQNKIRLPFGLYITNSVQEEVGLRGAQMIVEQIKPDVAIVTDVCHDTGTPMLDKIKQGDTVLVQESMKMHHPIKAYANGYISTFFVNIGDTVSTGSPLFEFIPGKESSKKLSKGKQTKIKPSQDWFRLHPGQNVDLNLLQQESSIYNNLIEQYDMYLEVIKDS